MICKIPHCVNESQCPTLGICKACYSSMLIAGKKTASQKASRLRNLMKFQARTELMCHDIRMLPKRRSVILTVLPGQVRPKLKLVKQKKLYAA